MKTLKEDWEKFQEEVLKDFPPKALEKAKKIFYSGAACAFFGVLENAEEGPEHLIMMMETYSKEIEEALFGIKEES